MSENELNEIQTKIALLEKDAKTGEQIHMRQQLSERVGVLEKWRWLIIGGSIIIGLMMSNPSGNLWEFLN
jgi:hypothetical protein